MFWLRQAQPPFPEHVEGNTAARGGLWPRPRPIGTGKARPTEVPRACLPDGLGRRELDPEQGLPTQVVQETTGQAGTGFGRLSQRKFPEPVEGNLKRAKASVPTNGDRQAINTQIKLKPDGSLDEDKTPE